MDKTTTTGNPESTADRHKRERNTFYEMGVLEGKKQVRKDREDERMVLIKEEHQRIMEQHESAKKYAKHARFHNNLCKVTQIAMSVGIIAIAIILLLN